MLAAVVSLTLLGTSSSQDSVTACTGSNRENCIDMDRCIVYIDGSTYDLSSLRQTGGSTADSASGSSTQPATPPSTPSACVCASVITC